MIAVFNTLGFANGASWQSQLGSIVIVGVYTLIVTLIIIKLLNIFIPLRVSREVESEGLDLQIHGERAYDFTS